MTTLFSLRSQLLAGGSHPLLLSGDRTVTASEVRDQALRLAAALSHHRAERWAIWLDQPGEFLVAFMALVFAGKTLCLPGNMQSTTATALSPDFDAILSHTSFGDIACPVISAGQLLDQDQPGQTSFTPVTDSDIDIILFTSGSTGEPKAIRKTLQLFEQEIEVLQVFGGEQLGRQPVVSTVSHQHIYGLLHLILWPLVRQAPVVDGVFQYPEEWLKVAMPLKPVTLVSSPTHIKRLADNSSFQQNYGVVGTIVSSGGLLAVEDASAMSTLTGKAPWEILGSTETGGVAWRCQSDSLVWCPLPGVNCRQDTVSGCLAVSSRHMGDIAGDNPWFVMGDRIRLVNNGLFELLGRADRLLKVEGKRVSATEMEARLVAHTWVRSASIVLLSGRREEVGAAIELDEAGHIALAAVGKLAVNRHLRDYLLASFERPVLPRRWRYPLSLPVNAQGKVTLADIEALFTTEESVQ